MSRLVVAREHRPSAVTSDVHDAAGDPRDDAVSEGSTMSNASPTGHATNAKAGMRLHPADLDVIAESIPHILWSAATDGEAALEVEVAGPSSATPGGSCHLVGELLRGVVGSRGHRDRHCGG